METKHIPITTAKWEGVFHNEPTLSATLSALDAIFRSLPSGDVVAGDDSLEEFYKNQKYIQIAVKNFK